MSSVVAIFSQTLNDALSREDFSISLPDVKPQTMRNLDGPNAGSRNWYEQSGKWSLNGCILQLLQPRMCGSQDTFLPLLLQTFLSVETGGRLLSLNTNPIYNSDSKFRDKKLGPKLFSIVGGLHHDFGQVFVYEWFLKSLASLVHLMIEAYDAHLLRLGHNDLVTQAKQNKQAKRRRVVSVPRPKVLLLGRAESSQTASLPRALPLRPSPRNAPQTMSKISENDAAYRGASVAPLIPGTFPELSIDAPRSKKPFLQSISTTLTTTKRILSREMRDFAWTASGGSIENAPSRRASGHAQRAEFASQWSPSTLPDLSVSTNSTSPTSTVSPRTPISDLSTRKPIDLIKDIPSAVYSPPYLTTHIFRDDISPILKPQEPEL